MVVVILWVTATHSAQILALKFNIASQVQKEYLKEIQVIQMDRGQEKVLLEYNFFLWLDMDYLRLNISLSILHFASEYNLFFFFLSL